MKRQSDLKTLRKTGLYRRLREWRPTGPTTAVVDGKEAAVFASNDYLGLSGHPAVTEAAAAAARDYGNSAAASRLISGNHPLYVELEHKLASLKGKEAALVFPTGYMANLGLISTLAGRGDRVFMDRLNHASLYDACRLSGAKLIRYPHNDAGRLLEQLEATEWPGRVFIATDGVFSMDGDIAPLAELSRAAREHECVLIVDDAHGTGVLGPAGQGTSAHLNTGVTIEIGTLSKALGSMGGFVAGDRSMIELLVNKSRPFIFTTGLPPATVAAASAALDLLESEPWRRTRVLEMSSRIRKRLSAAGFDIPAGITPIVPIMIGDEASAVALSDSCLDKGVFIPAIRHPAVPADQARLRLTVSAAHSDQEMERAIETLTSSARALGLPA